MSKMLIIPFLNEDLNFVSIENKINPSVNYQGFFRLSMVLKKEIQLLY